jgi:hypothetical protein
VLPYAVFPWEESYYVTALQRLICVVFSVRLSAAKCSDFCSDFDCMRQSVINEHQKPILSIFSLIYPFRTLVTLLSINLQKLNLELDNVKKIQKLKTWVSMQVDMGRVTLTVADRKMNGTPSEKMITTIDVGPHSLIFNGTLTSDRTP